jgi:rhodanese-related sulfurtransferase
MQTITAEEIKARLAQGEQLTVIDVREDDEVALGKIPGAKHIPLGEIPARIEEIPKDRETIMVCRSGNRSAMAIEFLKTHGYNNLINLAGGMLAWEKL